MSIMDKTNPVPTVDIIIQYKGGFVIIRRKFEPLGWALPGGFVDYGESLEHAAVREAKEETCLDVKLLNILGVLSEPGRDPRGRTVSIVYEAEMIGGKLQGSRETEEVKWFDTMPDKVAFDHANVLKDVMKHGV